MAMLSPAEYKAKIEAMKNGLPKPAPTTEAVSSSSIPESIDARVSKDATGYTANDGSGVKSDAVSGTNDNSSGTANSDTEASPTVLNAGDSEACAESALVSSIVAATNAVVMEEIANENQEATIDPQEAYCEACNKSVEDCDCVPDEELEVESEAAILASLGISKEQQETFKKSEPLPTTNDKDISAIVASDNTEDNLNSAAEIVAREYATNEDDLIVFRNIFNQTHEKVKDLLPDQLEQKILHLDKVIKAIQAMQQACKRLASDKKEKETKEEKAARYEREKKYKVPRRRGSDEVDATGALKKNIKGGKSKRDNLIETLMKAGLSREKAEAMADGN